MSLTHTTDKPRRKFKPTNKGGGSKKGKKQIPWPWIFKIAADAIEVRFKGSEEAARYDRRMIPTAEFKTAMDQLIPGWLVYRNQQFIQKYDELPDTDQCILLKNRTYKALEYNGTSAGNHGPIMTRADASKERWTKKFGPESAAAKLHREIVQGLITTLNWKVYLDISFLE